MVVGVAFGIAIFLALCLGIYGGWTFGMKHFTQKQAEHSPETHSVQ